MLESLFDKVADLKVFFIEHFRWLLLHNQDNVFTQLKIVKFHYLELEFSILLTGVYFTKLIVS